MISRRAAVETSAKISMLFPNRLTANVEIELECSTELVREEIAFYGSAGALIYSRSLDGRGGPAQRHFLSVQNGRTEEEKILKILELDQAPMRNLIGAILHGENLLSPISESVATVNLIESLYLTLGSVHKT
jgi:hypothetical protein